MNKRYSLKRSLLLPLAIFCFFHTAHATLQATPIPSMVVFGDSLSDNGNVTTLLKTLRMESDPGYLVKPLKQFVFNKMDDFATDYYVPQRVLSAGKAIVRQFLDVEVAPLLASVVSAINSVPLIPEAPYYEHHFTDGLVWNEQLANMLGLNIYNKKEFDNQAFGGSWAMTYDYQLTTWNLIRHPIASLQNLVSGKLIPPSLGLAIQAHLMSNRFKANPETLYFVFSGGNDYLNVLFFEDNYNPANLQTYINHAVDGVVYSTQKLIDAGAKNIALFGVPNVGNTPRFVHTLDKPILTTAANLHNAGLKERLNLLRKDNPSVTFTFVDIQHLLQQVVDKPDQYGLNNVVDACIDVPLPTAAFTRAAQSFSAFGGPNYVLEYAQYLKTPDGLGGFRANFSQCSNPKRYAFWDAVHPTARVHKLLAVKICQALSQNGYNAHCPRDRAA